MKGAVSMPDLLPRQFAIGEMLMGKGTPVDVTSFDPGSPEITDQDVTLPGEDGSAYGLDTLDGPVLTLEMSVDEDTEAACRDVWRQLAREWRNPRLRDDPLAVTSLSVATWHGTPVRVFGRPRKFDLANGVYLKNGRVDLQAEFKAADWKWYGEEEKTQTLRLLPSVPDSGIVFPLAFPITWGSYTESRADTVVNAGDTDTWPVVTFSGPVTNPSLELVGAGLKVTWQGSLAYDQSITLDTRPWMRTVLDQSGASAAGRLRGNRLQEFVLAPGSTVLRFGGNDLTGNARCVIRYRDAHTTI